MRIKSSVNKWKDMSDAKKASLALVFAKFCQQGISMVSVPIFTRIMVTEQYGSITNFISWQNIIIIFATLNLSQGVFNNGMLDFREDRERFTSSILVLANICTLICFGLYFIFNSILSPFTGLSNPLMLVMLLYMLFYPSFSYWSCRQRYEYKYKLLTILTILTTLCQVIFGIVVVLIVDVNQQALSKVVASESVLIIVGISMYIAIFVKAHFKIKFDYMRYAFKFNIFLVPHFLAMTVLACGDRVMITSMVGRTEAAIYSVSYTAASVIIVFWIAIEASWTPWLYEHLNAGNRKPIKKKANQIITIFALISILCMLFAPEIMRVLASDAYIEGVFIIPSVTAGVYFMAVYALYMRIEYYSKKTKATMIGSVSVAIANIILNYVFIKIFGYFAAGYTTLICYIFLYIFHFWYSRKIGMKDIYDDKFIMGLSLAIAVISIFVTFTYSHNELRYLVILSIAVVCILYRKKVIEQIKVVLE